MNDDRRLERDVATLFSETAPSRGPDDLLDDVFLQTRGMRPRPRWLAAIVEPPMRFSSTLAVGSPTLRVAAIMAATVVLVAAVGGAAIVGSRLLGVAPLVVAQDGSGDYETISAAVAVARDGDTVLVRPGAYPESVEIERDVTLRGDGDPGDIVVAFPIDSPRTRFIGNGIDEMNLPTGLAVRAADARIENLTIDLPDEGLGLLASGGHPTLADLRFEVAEGPEWDATTPPRAAFLITDGAEATVRDSRWDGWAGVRGGASVSFIGDTVSHEKLSIAGPGTSHVLDGEFSDGAAVFAREDARGSIEGNDFHGSHVKVFSGAEMLVRGNTILGAAGDPGIMVAHEGSRAELLDNVVRDSQRGVLITSGAEAILSGNTVCDNDENLIILAAPAPDLAGNEICEDPA